MMSRPEEYGAEMIALILARLEAGESLRGICRDPDMPGMTTVLRWLARDEGFRREYMLAREAQADAIFEELLAIADDCSQDWVESTSKTAKEGSYKLDHEHVTRSRLRIDTRKWVLARMSPRKYGDAVSLRHGGEAANPLTVLLAQVQGSGIGVTAEPVWGGLDGMGNDGLAGVDECLAGRVAGMASAGVRGEIEGESDDADGEEAGYEC